jgi:succinyl-CoA synthetase beta subunit
MNLYEHEGKAILRAHGIRTPDGILISRMEDIVQARNALGGKPSVLKAQLLSGKRAAQDAIAFVDTEKDIEQRLSAWHAKGWTQALLEERVETHRELYLSCLYDAVQRAPLLLIGEEGGSAIESKKNVRRFPIDPRKPSDSLKLIADALSAVSPRLPETCEKLVTLFFEEDAKQVEINPLAEYIDGSLIALDAKIALDTAAQSKHPEWSRYPPRTTLGRASTGREQEAERIDTGAEAHRGNAGTFFELDGDVATLFSGGGASLVNMDAMARHGLKAANYAEYSGNPPKEKVAALARLVLSKPGLRGALIVGGIANFTDIQETFAGIAEALDELKPAYPIVVRRAGPKEREGLALLRACAERCGLQMELYGKDTTMEDAVLRLKTLMV